MNKHLNKVVYTQVDRVRLFSCYHSWMFTHANICLDAVNCCTRSLELALHEAPKALVYYLVVYGELRGHVMQLSVCFITSHVLIMSQTGGGDGGLSSAKLHFYQMELVLVL